MIDGGCNLIPPYLLSRDSAQGKLETAVDYGRVYALPALFHCTLGQPHRREGGEALRDIHLHIDAVSVDPEHSSGIDGCKQLGQPVG